MPPGPPSPASLPLGGTHRGCCWINAGSRLSVFQAEQWGRVILRQNINRNKENSMSGACLHGLLPSPPHCETCMGCVTSGTDDAHMSEDRLVTYHCANHSKGSLKLQRNTDNSRFGACMHSPLPIPPVWDVYLIQYML